MPPSPQSPARQVLRAAFFVHFVLMAVLSGILGICASGPLVLAGLPDGEHTKTIGAATFGLALLVGSALAANAARERTIMDDNGVKMVRPWGSRSVTWQAVASLEIGRSRARWWLLEARAGDEIITLYRHPQHEVPLRALSGAGVVFDGGESTLSRMLRGDEATPDTFRHACAVVDHYWRSHLE